MNCLTFSTSENALCLIGGEFPNGINIHSRNLVLGGDHKGELR